MANSIREGKHIKQLFGRLGSTSMIEKLKESALSVAPIAAIVSLLCLCIVPTEAKLLLAFLVGAAFIILGMGLFSLGAEQSMTPIGNKIGQRQIVSDLLHYVL